MTRLAVHEGPAALTPSRARLDGAPLPSPASPRGLRAPCAESIDGELIGRKRLQIKHTTRGILLTLALAATLTLTGVAQAKKSTPAHPLELMESHHQELFDRIAPAVVYIQTKKGLGSGFFIKNNGLILTNAHVVGEGKTVTVVMHDGKSVTGRVVEHADNDIDLALVQVNVGKTPCLEVGSVDELRIGSWVASIGHGMGGVWTYNTGMISNIYPIGAERPVIQTQIPLNPGNSGGPVFDRHGRVVGVVVAGVVESNAINFAIRMDYAFRVLKRLSDMGDFLVITAPDDALIFVDGVAMGKGPRLALTVEPGRHEVSTIHDGKMYKKTIHYPKVNKVNLAALPGAVQGDKKRTRKRKVIGSDE